MRRHARTSILVAIVIAGASGLVATDTAAQPARPREGQAAAGRGGDQPAPTPPDRGRARPTAGAPARPPLFHVNGFFTVGYQGFAAKETFEATTGAAGGRVLGGGGSLTHRSGLFAQVDVTRFAADGERAFVANGQVFPLGIPLEVAVRPLEFTFGYKFFMRPGAPKPRPPAPPPAAKPGAGEVSASQARPAPPGTPAPAATRPATGRRAFFGLRPYVGAGFGLVQYTETADFSAAGDNVEDRFTSYHVTGGVEVPLWKWFGAAAEFNLRWVKDAFGEAGLSGEFGEDDLGGPSFRVKLTVGR